MSEAKAARAGKKHLSGRARLRGKPLSQDCRRARCSGVEFMRGGVEYHGCHGLTDVSPGIYNEECLECGALAWAIGMNG